MSLTRSVGRNTAVQFGGKILGTILGVVTAAIMQRYLAPEGYGAYTAAMAYVGFLSVVADLGLYLMLIRELNVPGADEGKVTGNILALRWTSAVSILGAGALAAWFLPAYAGDSREAIAIITVSFVAVAATQVLVGVFTTKMAMVNVTVAELAGRLVLLAGTWYVVYSGGTLQQLMWAVVAGSVANFAIVFIAARRFVPVRLRFDFPYWRRIVRETWPVALSIIFNLMYFKADTILLSLLNQGNYAIGIYGAAYKVIEILITFPIMFVGLLLPSLGRMFAEQQHERFRAIFQRGFDVVVMFAVPILVGGWVVAEDILVAIGGPAFAPGAPVLQLLLLAVAAMFLNSLSGHTITLIHRQRQMLWGYLAIAVIGIATYLVLIPRYSYYGAAWGTIVTETLAAVIGYALVTRAIGFRLRLGLLPRTLAAAALMGGTMWLQRDLHPLLAAISGTVVYAAGIILFRVITLSTIREIFSSRSGTSA